MKDFVKKVSQKLPKLSSEQVEQLIEDLKAEYDELDSIMESLSTGLIIVDADWHLELTNKAAERLIPFTVRPSDYRGDSVPVWQMIDDASLAAFLQNCAQKNSSHEDSEFSFVQDSNVRFVSVKVTPLVRKSDISGSIISVSDITEKRQQEIILHRMESLASLTSLAASVAHEIKNPLGAISIHIQLLQKAVKKARDGDGTLPAPKFMEDYLSVINEEIDNLNKIVLDFLFAVRPVQSNPVLSDPDVQIEKFASFFEPEAQSRAVTCTLHLCKQGERLLIDEKLFREVLMNLTQNAFGAIQERFSSETGGELHIESFIKNERYWLTIADNGCGMDEQTASRIFEPYYTTKANGTGLGLTTVYKIIKEFKGDINVQSVKGHGTVFTISIPLPQKRTLLLEDATGGSE
ncbi:MAG: PAS domain S-box protein [Treponema sp.]|nr:PAS domain S-box protein [Treponema sp.]